MTEDRRTRADLMAELARAEERLTAATEREQGRDLEARAFDDCVRVLGYLEQLSRPNRQQTGTSAGYDFATGPGFHALPPATPVSRVLDYLRVRFGLPDPLVEVRELSARLATVEQERDRLRSQLASVAAATAGDAGGWLR